MSALNRLFESLDGQAASLVRSFSLPIFEFSGLAESTMRRAPTPDGLNTYMTISEEIANNAAERIPKRLSEAVSAIGAQVWISLDQMSAKRPIDAQGLIDIAHEQIDAHFEMVRLHYARRFRNALLMDDAAARYEVGSDMNPITATLGGFKIPSNQFLTLTSRKFLVDWINQARVATMQGFGRQLAQVVSGDIKSSNDGMIFNIAPATNSYPNFTDIVDTVFHPRSYALAADYDVSA